jgi:hypothetical protein
MRVLRVTAAFETIVATTLSAHGFAFGLRLVSLFHLGLFMFCFFVSHLFLSLRPRTPA